MAYEIFYAYATTSTFLERLSFSMWFLFDFTFAAVTIFSVYKPGYRWDVAERMITGVLLFFGLFWGLAKLWPDEREQVTAYWTGLALQFPIGWGSLWLLVKHWDTKGHSLEIW